jgi:two-component system response regulator
MSLDGIEILLVDDSSADVELTLRALRHDALVDHIHIARDGEEALNFIYCREPFQKRAAEPLPRLILLDLNMPKVDGLSVLRTLKEDPRTRAIPVVILTSSKEEKDVAKSYAVGVNSYIQKPVNFDQFREAVHTLGLYWLSVNQAPPRQNLDTSVEKPG